MTAYLAAAVPIAHAEIPQLGALRLPAHYAASLQRALQLAGQEEGALKSLLSKLHNGQPFATVYSELYAATKSLDPQVNAAFVKAGLPECAK